MHSAASLGGGATLLRQDTNPPVNLEMNSTDRGSYYAIPLQCTAVSDHCFRECVCCAVLCGEGEGEEGGEAGGID